MLCAHGMVLYFGKCLRGLRSSNEVRVTGALHIRREINYFYMAKKLFIGSLAWATKDDSLMNHFASVGPVASARVVMDKMTGRSKGFGFVEYDNDADADAAVAKLNGSELDGRTITVQEARPRE